jgi:hypothetical protein
VRTGRIRKKREREEVRQKPLKGDRTAVKLGKWKCHNEIWKLTAGTGAAHLIRMEETSTSQGCLGDFGDRVSDLAVGQALISANLKSSVGI